MALTRKFQLRAAFFFGVVFVALILVIAVFIPRPSEFQVLTFRIVLALAAAGVGAVIPGFININMTAGNRTWLRAGGAIALFVVIFFFSPAQLISEPPKQKLHEGFVSALRDHLDKNVSLDEFQLILAGKSIKELERLWIKEVSGKTWGELLQKICNAHRSCLHCDPFPDQTSKRVSISLSGPVLPGKTSEGVVMYSCAK